MQDLPDCLQRERRVDRRTDPHHHRQDIVDAVERGRRVVDEPEQRIVAQRRHRQLGDVGTRDLVHVAPHLRDRLRGTRVLQRLGRGGQRLLTPGHIALVAEGLRADHDARQQTGRIAQHVVEIDRALRRHVVVLVKVVHEQQIEGYRARVLVRRRDRFEKVGLHRARPGPFANQIERLLVDADQEQPRVRRRVPRLAQLEAQADGEIFQPLHPAGRFEQPGDEQRHQRRDERKAVGLPKRFEARMHRDERAYAEEPRTSVRFFNVAAVYDRR